MKIAIISDTHDNLANFKKIIDWLNREKIQLILHCGDVCTKATLEEIKRSFLRDIKIVLGNADIDLDVPEIEEIEIDSKRVAFTHYYKIARKLAESGKYDLVFHGHTHKPFLEKIGDCRVVNPGTAGGLFYKATFAVYDTETDKLELKILESLNIDKID